MHFNNAPAQPTDFSAPPSSLAVAEKAPDTPSEQPDVESSSDEYALRFAGPVGAWFLNTQSRITTEVLAPLPSGLRVLDVGGGHGQLVQPLLAAGHDVTVLGSTDGCATRLDPWLREGCCRFDVGSLQTLPYADHTFDVAVCFRILPHLSAPERLISELCRVAKRSVVVDFPSARSVNLLAETMFSWKLRVERSTREFTVFQPREIEDAFGAAGFRVAVSHPQYFLPMALHRAMRCRLASRTLEASARAVGLTRAWGSPVILRAERIGGGF